METALTIVLGLLCGIIMLMPLVWILCFCLTTAVEMIDGLATAISAIPAICKALFSFISVIIRLAFGCIVFLFKLPFYAFALLIGLIVGLALFCRHPVKFMRGEIQNPFEKVPAQD